MARRGGEFIEAQTVTILFSDIRGFTAYTAAEGDEHAYHLVEIFNQLVQKGVDQHGGRVIKTYGDGVMVTFQSAKRAVLCAVELQEALKEYNRQHLEEAIFAGVGINTAEPIRAGDDFIGHAVNLAKRLAEKAKGGQILISSFVKELAGTVGDLQYLDLGEQELEGVGRQHLYEIIWRAELARLSTKDDLITLILTGDGKFVMEFSKEALIQKARDEIRHEAHKHRGPTRWLLRGAEKFTGWILDKAINYLEIGKEHDVAHVELAVKNHKFVASLEPSPTLKRKAKLAIGAREIDLREAEAFVQSFKHMKRRLHISQAT